MSALKCLKDSASLADGEAFLSFQVVQHQVEISRMPG